MCLCVKRVCKWRLVVTLSMKYNDWQFLRQTQIVWLSCVRAESSKLEALLAKSNEWSFTGTTNKLRAIFADGSIFAPTTTRLFVNVITCVVADSYRFENIRKNIIK